MRQFAKAVLLCAALLLPFGILPQQSIAQFGAYIDEGVGAGAGVRSSDNANQIEGSAGYVFNSTVEAGLSVLRNEPDQTDVTATGIGPYAAVYPVREGEQFPISIRLSGGYRFMSYSGDAVDRLESQGRDVSGNAFHASVGAFRVYATSEVLQIIPYASAGYTSNTLEVSEGGQFSGETNSSTSAGFSLTFLFLTSESTSFALSPSVSFSEDSSSYGLSVAFVFPQ